MNAFISYSHNDSATLDILHKHLAQLRRDGTISAWTDNEIPAGGVLDKNISKALDHSSLFIALLSPDYIASNYCYENEFKKALSLQEQDKITIVPIVLEPCDWHNTPFSQFKALPKDGKPVNTWENKNTAFLDVIQNIRKLIQLPIEVPKATPTTAQIAVSRNYRVQKDFDSIQKLEFIEKTFHEVTDLLKRYLEEVVQIDNIKSRTIVDSKNEFTCMLINRNKINTEAQLTLSTVKEKGFFGAYGSRESELIYSLSRDQSRGASKGFNLAFDEFHLYWSVESYSSSTKEELGSKQIADLIYNEWLSSVGIL